VVLSVFPIGANSTTPPAPAGTAHLSIGVNSYGLWNNTGAWVINWRSSAPADSLWHPSSMVDWLISIEDLLTTVNDLDGGSDLADLIFTVNDRGGAITADFPTFVFEGKTVQLLVGYDGLAFTDYVPLFTGRIDSVESSNSNNDYVFTCPDASADLSQNIYALGDDGFATSSTHPRTLNGHPLDILLSALAECGYMSSEIDVALITTYRDNIYSGFQMQFNLESSPVAKDFIESELLKPLGAYRKTNNLGQITVEFPYPPTATPVFNFNPTNLLTIPAAGQADLINQVVTRMDATSASTSTNGFSLESVDSDFPSINKYGLYGQQIIESTGMRSGLNGVGIARMTAFMLFLRYGNKALCHGDNGKNSPSDPINTIWQAALVEPGDYVTLTHPQVPDRAAGVIGVTAKAYVVMDRTWQFFQGNVQYKMIEIDLSKFRQSVITGNTEASYTVASLLDRANDMFLCDEADQYSNGDPANTLSLIIGGTTWLGFGLGFGLEF
jgi:hypothetical protein